MDGQEKLLDYETIKAAVAGEKWATEKVLAHYADYIDELSTVEIRQPDGKVKKVIDEDMRQHISLKLLEALPSSRWNKNNDQEGCTLLRRFAAITCTPPKQIHPLRVCTCFGG